MFFIFRLIIVAVTLLIITQIVPGFSVSSFYIALVVAILLGLLNVTLKPILVLLTMPLTILTLGLFLFVINAGILLLLASFVEGFAITSFWSAISASLILTIINWFSHRILK